MPSSATPDLIAAGATKTIHADVTAPAGAAATQDIYIRAQLADHRRDGRSA